MSEGESTSRRFSGVCRDCLFGLGVLAATSALAWWFTVGMSLPYVALYLETLAVGWVSYRLIRMNTFGTVLWCLAAVIAITLWVSLPPQTLFPGPLLVLCAFAGLVLLLISCVVFLVTAFQDPTRRGRNCAGCVFAISSLMLLGRCAVDNHRHIEYREAVEHTTVTFATLNKLVAEVESVRTRLGRLPKDEDELVELRGSPMPTFWKEYRIHYYCDPLDGNRYYLNCSLQSFWGHGWDIFPWEVLYYGPDSPRRIQLIAF